MRRVMTMKRIYEGQRIKGYEDVREGWFHQWFTDADSEPAAIIELDNGSVDVYQHHYIRFMSPPGR